MCQLVLPGMREQRWGKIVNLSSMGGRLTFPGGGFYHATKYAVEAISDALRFEVRGFGVDVVLIEPGLIRTRVRRDRGDGAIDGIRGRRPVRGVQRGGRHGHGGVYESGPLAKLGGPPEAVAKRIEKAITASRPRARYTVTASARALIGQRRHARLRLGRRSMRTQFPQPGR